MVSCIPLESVICHGFTLEYVLLIYSGLSNGMYNWSVDETAMKKADPEGYEIWRLEQMINWGLDGERLNEKLVRKYWGRLYLDSPTRAYLEHLLWPQKTTFLPKNRKNF